MNNNNYKKNANNDPYPENPPIIKNIAELPPSIVNWIEENNNGIFVLLGKEGRILYISKSLERITGYKVADFIGRPWYEKISTEDIAYINSSKQFSDYKTNLTFSVLNSVGKTMRMECSIQEVENSDTTSYQKIAYLKDITYKRETEEIMVRSEKMSIAGQLAAGIAHEIRNPLTSLKGFLQLMQAGVIQEKYFDIMIEEIDKIEAITSELLFISKPLTDTKKLEKIENMIEDVVILLQPQASIKDIEIVMERPVKGMLYCDRSQMKQVLINLVKNAIESMEGNGKIVLSSNENEDNVEITICDEGAGIPKEILHKLGEPFFTTKTSGTGLGLLISKQILEAHDGRLAIMPNEPKGSIFKLIFPAQTPL